MQTYLPALSQFRSASSASPLENSCSILHFQRRCCVPFGQIYLSRTPCRARTSPHFYSVPGQDSAIAGLEDIAISLALGGLVKFKFSPDKLRMVHGSIRCWRHASGNVLGSDVPLLRGAQVSLRVPAGLELSGL
jgi:hypothetical protein